MRIYTIFGIIKELSNDILSFFGEKNWLVLDFQRFQDFLGDFNVFVKILSLQDFGIVEDFVWFVTSVNEIFGVICPAVLSADLVAANHICSRLPLIHSHFLEFSFCLFSDPQRCKSLVSERRPYQSNSHEVIRNLSCVRKEEIRNIRNYHAFDETFSQSRWWCNQARFHYADVVIFEYRLL